MLGRVLLGLLAVTSTVSAADSPEWQTKGCRMIGIIERIPANGLKVKWRAPVRAGYSGPVARDRVSGTPIIAASIMRVDLAPRLQSTAIRVYVLGAMGF